MPTFQEAIVPETETSVRNKIRAYAVAAGLKVTNWRIGAIGQQMLEWWVAGQTAFTSVTSTYIRGFVSLDTSTDPGDVDAYDSGNVLLAPEAGMLSAFGSNTFSTDRIEKTFASGNVTFTNSGTVSRAFAPYGLTFTWTVSPPAGTTLTYRNVEDATIYTDPGGTVTIAPGASIVLPARCDIDGAIGSCPSGSLTLTTSLLGCTATNAEPFSGNDREDAEAYRIRCRNAAARLSMGGPSAVYEYLSKTNLDGTPLFNSATPPAQVAITRTYVQPDSSTGIAVCYYATDTGAPSADDVAAANANITTYALAVPDCVTFTGTGAIEANVTVSGTARIKATPGIDTAEIKAAIVARLAAFWQTIPIGGFDNSGTSGVIYHNDVEAEARAAWPGLYDVVLTAPSGSSTTILSGRVATLTSAVGNWTITVVS